MSHRNEPARERRRRLIKQDTSLVSMPLDDKKMNFTLENHFGWTTLQKCQVGDGNIPRYPQVVQYHEKPEIYGPNYQKVTYVLYLKDKDNTLGKREREIQTSKTLTLAKDPTVIDHPDPPPKKHKAVEQKKNKKEHVVKEEPKKKADKHKITESPSNDSIERKKLIDSFYYKKKDRSPSGDRIFKPMESEEAYKLPESNPVVVENYTTNYVPPGKKKPKKEKSRSAPKSWQVRAAAGAESGSDGFMVHHIGEYKESEEYMEEEQEYKENRETKPRLNRDRRGYLYYNGACDSLPKNIKTEGEVLWDSPSKANEYLYLSKSRAARPLKDRS